MIPRSSATQSSKCLALLLLAVTLPPGMEAVAFTGGHANGFVASSMEAILEPGGSLSTARAMSLDQLIEEMVSAPKPLLTGLEPTSPPALYHVRRYYRFPRFQVLLEKLEAATAVERRKAVASLLEKLAEQTEDAARAQADPALVLPWTELRLFPLAAAMYDANGDALPVLLRVYDAERAAATARHPLGFPEQLKAEIEAQPDLKALVPDMDVLEVGAHRGSTSYSRFLAACIREVLANVGEDPDALTSLPAQLRADLSELALALRFAQGALRALSAAAPPGLIEDVPDDLSRRDLLYWHVIETVLGHEHSFRMHVSQGEQTDFLRLREDVVISLAEQTMGYIK